MSPISWLALPYGPIGPMAVRVAELDTADPEIVVAAHSGLYVLRGPDRTVERLSSDAATDVEVADLDGDGDLDVVAAHYFADEVRWYENSAAGFSTAHVLPGLGPFEVEVGDTDRDDALEILATLSRGDAVVSWEIQGGDPTVLRELEAPRTLLWIDELVVVDAAGTLWASGIDESNVRAVISTQPGRRDLLVQTDAVRMFPRSKRSRPYEVDGIPGTLVHHGFHTGDLFVTTDAGLSWVVKNNMSRDALKFREVREVAAIPGIVDLDLGDISDDGREDVVVATDRLLWIENLSFDVTPVLGPPTLPAAKAKKRCGVKGTRLEGPTLTHLTATDWYDAECTAHPLPDGATDLLAYDLDGDGDLDLLGPDGWWQQGGETPVAKADIVDAPVRVALPEVSGQAAQLVPIDRHDPTAFCPRLFPKGHETPRVQHGPFGKRTMVSSRFEWLDRSAQREPDQLRLFFTRNVTEGGRDDLGHPMGGEGTTTDRYVCEALIQEGEAFVGFSCREGLLSCDAREPYAVRDGGAGPDATARFADWLARDEWLIVMGAPAEPVEGLMLYGAGPLRKALATEMFRGVPIGTERGLGHIVVGDILEEP